MPGKDERDPLDDWLGREIHPLPPPAGTFELITKRARRRKIRKLAATVTSAAAVTAAVVFAVPTVRSLHLGQSSANGTPVAGLGPGSTPVQRTNAGDSASPQGTAIRPSGGPIQERPSQNPQAGLPAGGPIPPNFRPTSITFIGTDIGWAIGQAGPSCYNPGICTSVVLTRDGGRTWRGIHAPVSDSVTGIRFLDHDGWAYGPALYDTHDSGQDWTAVNTGTQQVIDLETAGTRAFALFATCAEGPSSKTVSANCSSYTLETSQAGSDTWSAVSPATTNLPDSPGATPSIVLSGSTGWLLAADGTIYSGPLDGTWTKLGVAPCSTPQSATGEPLLTWDVYNHVLVAACGAQPTQAAGSQSVPVLTSSDTTLTWNPLGTATPQGVLTSLATAPGALAILATTSGIWTFQPGTGQWTQTASLTNGFSYVGMTTDKQGVAIPADTSLHEVYMTYDGGQTWIARPIIP
jgi:hypothetical protein